MAFEHHGQKEVGENPKMYLPTMYQGSTIPSFPIWMRLRPRDLLVCGALDSKGGGASPIRDIVTIVINITTPRSHFRLQVAIGDTTSFKI